MTDLLPCPFCGGEEIESLVNLDFVACQDCGASLEDSEPSARALWNTRTVTTYDAKIDALVKALHIFLPPGNEPMEEIIWENQMDDAPMKITLKYGQYKKARAALLAVVGTSGGQGERS